MRSSIITFLVVFFASSYSNLFAQNLDYNSRITQFIAGNGCPELGNEEHTWTGFLSDNVMTAETPSGCVQKNYDGATTQSGTYATRNRTNVAATSFRARILAWEDDAGSRCSYDLSAFGGGDDCRTQMSTFRYFSNPNEFSYTSDTFTLGNSDYGMNVFYQYRYATTSLPDATEYTASTFATGGNRPFWGSRGNWAFSGADCAASGTITHNQTSSFSTMVSCKSMVSFSWRVSSQANADYLYVFVNGVKKDSISGTVGWTTKSVALDTGANTVEWRYVKDDSISTGLDRGFVDFITFTNATSVNPGIISGSQLIVAGGSVSTLASVQPALGFSNTVSYQWQYSNGTSWSNIGGAVASTYGPGSAYTTTYYRRRVQDGCGNTGYSYSNTVVANVMPYVANTVATDTSVGYITSGSWHHFYNSSNEVIFSLQGNITGAATTPIVTITKNSTYYQDLGTPANCTTGPSPGDAKFEMERSWNVSYTGTLSGTYNVRFYYLQAELDSVVGASYRHQNNNPNCTYGNRFGGSNGFYWFKTTTPTYAAPTYDTTNILSSLYYSLSSTLKYAQLSGITGFSGGSGGIVLRPVSFLPVDLINFTGSLNERDNVELEWSTASELNNSGFYIQRSRDNEYFEEIGYVEGSGTSNSYSSYHFEDESYKGGKVYYRLEQVDYDGSISYTESIAVDKENNGTVIVGKPLPNPTKGEVSIVIISPQKNKAYIDVTDQYGQRIENFEQDLASGQTKVKLDLQPYRSGLYYAIIQVGNESFTKKIVLTR